RLSTFHLSPLAGCAEQFSTVRQTCTRLLSHSLVLMQSAAVSAVRCDLAFAQTTRPTHPCDHETVLVLLFLDFLLGGASLADCIEALIPKNLITEAIAKAFLWGWLCLYRRDGCRCF